jgi:CheY-like chemotaxis protein
MSQKILVVDDSPTERFFLADLLAKRGYTVITAENGNEAYEKTKAERPDLVLMDVVMPGASGFQVTRALARDPDTMGIPVDDSYAKHGEPPVWADFRRIVRESGLHLGMTPIPKWDFYNAVESPDHVLTIQTGDQALWANVLLTMGCRTA